MFNYNVYSDEWERLSTSWEQLEEAITLIILNLTFYVSKKFYKLLKEAMLGFIY
jgi:hypothetical protein